MRAVKYVVFAGMLGSCLFSLYALQRALELSEGVKNGQVSAEAALAQLLPSALAARLSGATPAAAPPPASRRELRESALIDSESASRSVTVSRGRGLDPKPGGAVLIDADGRRYEVEPLAGGPAARASLREALESRRGRLSRLLLEAVLVAAAGFLLARRFRTSPTTWP